MQQSDKDGRYTDQANKTKKKVFYQNKPLGQFSPYNPPSGNVSLSEVLAVRKRTNKHIRKM